MGKRTDDRSVNIDVVPNGVAFNLAKSWLGLVKKKKDDDEDDGNVRQKRERERKQQQQQQQRDVLVRTSRRDSKEEEENDVDVRRHGGKGGGGSQRANARLGLGAKYASHSKAARTMQTIAEKKIFDRVQREKHTRRMGGKGTRARKFLLDEDEDEEDVRGLSKSKKRRWRSLMRARIGGNRLTVVVHY